MSHNPWCSTTSHNNYIVATMGSPLSQKEDKFVRPCVRHDRHAPRRATPGTPAAVKGWGKQTCFQGFCRGDEFIFEIRFIWRDHQKCGNHATTRRHAASRYVPTYVGRSLGMILKVALRPSGVLLVHNCYAHSALQPPT